MKYPTDPLKDIATGGLKKMQRTRPAVINELILDGYLQPDATGESYQITSYGQRKLSAA